MKLAVLSIGSSKESWYLELCQAYQKKISAFVDFEDLRLRSQVASRARAEEKRLRESELLLKSLSSKDFVVLLDERGQKLSSRQFSDKMVKGFESGRARLVFVLGGAYGASDPLKERADQVWSLSELTFNHLVAHGVLLEQVYRAFTLWRGIPYHND